MNNKHNSSRNGNRNRNRPHGNQQSRNTGPALPNGITAPYNFVPSTTRFGTRDWRKRTSIDVPFEEGMCGELTFNLTTHSPLMIGDKKSKNGVVDFSKIDGKPVIPGSSIRGMVRSIAEVVTFAKLQWINDKLPTMRDIKNDIYKKALTDKRQKIRVKTGWLSFDSNAKCYVIRCCDYARVRHTDLESTFNVRRLGSLKTVAEKYNKVGGIGNTINFRITGKNRAGEPEATSGKGGNQTGHVVVTGWAYNKRNEFIFYNTAKKQIIIPKDKLSNFLAIYDAEGDAKSPYQTLRKMVNKSKLNLPGVPLFYTLNNSGELEYMGLTQMMKLPGKWSTKEIQQKQQAFSANGPADIVENLLGRTIEEENPDEFGYNLKSRVSFSDCTMLEGEQVSQPVEVLLGQPQASFFPAYLQQGERNPQTGKLSARQINYHSLQGQQLRGFKRYPVQANVPIKPNMSQLDKPLAEHANVTSKIKPLCAGAKFNGKIRFHNVRPNELGLILWVLTWGQDNALFHNLGMAKPYGYGSCQCDITTLNVEPNNAPGDWQDHTHLIGKYIDDITKTMDSLSKGLNLGQSWKDTRQLKELKLMATPKPAQSAHFRYLKLTEHKHAKAKDSKTKDKDKAKVQDNEQNGFVLRSYSEIVGK